jgi:hypothetical protein
MRRDDGLGWARAIRNVMLAVVLLPMLTWGACRVFAGERGGQSVRPKGNAYLKYRRDRCEWCGQKGTLLNGLQVHHNLPASKHPELFLCPTNLMTLHGRTCHFVIGHQCNFKNEFASGIDVVHRYGKAPWTNDPYMVTNP